MQQQINLLLKALIMELQSQPLKLHHLNLSHFPIVLKKSSETSKHTAESPVRKVTKTAGISSKETDTVCPFSADDIKLMINDHFTDDPENVVHNYFSCNDKQCFKISRKSQDLISPKKFNHSWLNAKQWWLCFLESTPEKTGLYCLICKKHHGHNPRNKFEKFVNEPSVRFKLDALACHQSASSHTDCIKSEFLQRISVFHKLTEEKKRVNKDVLYQVFATCYFLMKEFIPNRKLIAFLELVEKVFNGEQLGFFDYRSPASIREIFISIGETVKTASVERIKKCDAYGLMIDEVTDVSVTEQLITFIQYFDYQRGRIRTDFLSVQDALAEYESANSEAIFNILIKELASCNLDTSKMMGLSTDGAAVMLG